MRDCYLYTLDGVKEATASDVISLDHYPYHAHRIKAKDDSVSILVNIPTVKRKFEDETKPTFYSC